jgi:hypothetical protein
MQAALAALASQVDSFKGIDRIYCEPTYPIQVPVRVFLDLVQEAVAIDRPLLLPLVYNIGPFFTEFHHQFEPEQIHELWLCMIVLASHLHSEVEFRGFCEAILAVLVYFPDIPECFTDFLASEIAPNPEILPFVIAALYEDLTADFFTANAAHLRPIIVNGLMQGDANHRLTLVNLLCSLGLTDETFSEVADLDSRLWAALYSIVTESPALAGPVSRTFRALVDAVPRLGSTPNPMVIK